MMLNDLLCLADLVALKPSSYVIRIVVGISAFMAALHVESTLSRAIGLAILLVTGGGLLLLGIGHGTVVDVVLGVAGLAAAGYSWWFTRH